MTKITNPLLSFKASGPLAKTISFVKRLGQPIVEKKPEIPDTKSLSQLSWRHMYLKAVALWHALSAVEKQEWESLARRRHMTGFAWFMSQCLKPNPGIYLPLQGGTMSGDIDMDSHRILALLDPTVNQEVATKKYVDDAAGYVAHKTTHQDGGSDEIDVVGLSGLLADDQHVLDAEVLAVAAALVHAARHLSGGADSIKLDDLAAPDDNTDLDFSISKHGLVPKGTSVGNFLKDDGTWAAAGGVMFTDYHYYEDLAAGATYTPSVKSFGMIMSQDWGYLDINLEFYDGGAWIRGDRYGTERHAHSSFFQDNDQNIRIINDDGSNSHKISLTGATWS